MRHASVERLQGEGFDFESTHLLCQALKRRTELQGHGYEVRLLTETLERRFVLYFLAHKPAVPKPTRAERGCEL